MTPVVATESSETPHVTTISGGTPNGPLLRPLLKTVIVATTNTTVNVASAETRVETEMNVEDVATLEIPAKNPKNQNTIRIIRKKIDMMETTIVLTATEIPLNTTSNPLSNLPPERK